MGQFFVWFLHIIMRNIKNGLSKIVMRCWFTWCLKFRPTNFFVLSLSLSLPLSDTCKKYTQDKENYMEETEKRLLQILDDIGTKRQAYHGNIFTGNQCKLILTKDKNQVYNFEKIYTGRLERIMRYSCFISKAHSFMSRKHFLPDHEKARLTSLSHKYGQLFPACFQGWLWQEGFINLFLTALPFLKNMGQQVFLVRRTGKVCIMR